MRRITRHHKRLKLVYLVSAFVICLFMSLAFPWFRHAVDAQRPEETYYCIVVNGMQIGCIEDKDIFEGAFLDARMKVQKENKSAVYLDADINIYEQNKVTGKLIDEEGLTDKLYNVIKDESLKVNKTTYVVDIEGKIINLGSMSEVVELLNAAKNKYDEQGNFTAELKVGTGRFTLYEYSMVRVDESSSAIVNPELPPVTNNGEATSKDPIVNGVMDLVFSEEIKVIQSYVSADELNNLGEAIEDITKEKEKNQTYTVVAGDTLSKIAKEFDLTVNDLLVMNNLDVNDYIRIGDEIIVTVPTPDLSVVVKEQQSYREEYNLPVQYVYNDTKYTTYSKVKKEGSAGVRDVVAVVSYCNGMEVEREILNSVIITEPVAKVVEVGTLEPPTYIKPINGNYRVTSEFGWRELEGKQNYHKGVDWGCPTGTSVRAACSGTVIKAGWGGSYGYYVVIKHVDGSQTLYAHLSKVQVSVGQKVKQNERIGLSGNTGYSFGAHLHFEIIINGTPRNPLKYID